MLLAITASELIFGSGSNGLANSPLRQRPLASGPCCWPRPLIPPRHHFNRRRPLLAASRSLVLTFPFPFCLGLPAALALGFSSPFLGQTLPVQRFSHFATPSLMPPLLLVWVASSMSAFAPGLALAVLSFPPRAPLASHALHIPRGLSPSTAWFAFFRSLGNFLVSSFSEFTSGAPPVNACSSISVAAVCPACRSAAVVRYCFCSAANCPSPCSLCPLVVPGPSLRRLGAPCSLWLRLLLDLPPSRLSRCCAPFPCFFLASLSFFRLGVLR